MRRRFDENENDNLYVFGNRWTFWGISFLSFPWLMNSDSSKFYFLVSHESCVILSIRFHSFVINRIPAQMFTHSRREYNQNIYHNSYYVPFHYSILIMSLSVRRFQFTNIIVEYINNKYSSIAYDFFFLFTLYFSIFV